jgi:heme oxygenase (mycobilin-producing)
MISVTHFDVAPSDSEFAHRAELALAALAARPGYLNGRIGRATDDERQWIMVTEWANVGSYRRALGGFEVKVNANPLLAQARDEPSAFEELITIDPNGAVARHESDRA